MFSKKYYTGRKLVVFAVVGLAAVACIILAAVYLFQMPAPNNLPDSIVYNPPELSPAYEVVAPAPYETTDGTYAHGSDIQLDKWIYYSDPEDKNKLYKIKADGTEKIKLTDKRAWDVQVVEDWVYYVNDYVDIDAGDAAPPHDPNDDSVKQGYAMICKISINGGEETCIYEAEKQAYSYENYGREKYDYYRTIQDMTVNNNIIYFREADLENNDFYATNICKIDIDGSKTIIAKIRTENFSAYDGYIFYYDHDEYTMYKMRDNGTEKVRFLDEGSIAGDYIDFTIKDGWMYYLGYMFSDKATGEIASAKNYVDEEKNIVQSAGGISSDKLEEMMTIQKERVFCRIRLDGTEKIKLSDKNIFKFIIGNDWIYYDVYDDTTGDCFIYKIKTDGSENQLILAGEYLLNDIVGEWLYIYIMDNWELFKIKTDGTELQNVK